jgi:endoglucanase
VKKGIYVLMDWHEHNGYLHIQEAKHFFGKMAEK